MRNKQAEKTATYIKDKSTESCLHPTHIFEAQQFPERVNLQENILWGEDYSNVPFRQRQIVSFGHFEKWSP